MNDVRRNIEGIADLEDLRRFAIDQEREFATELIAEFMGIGVNVPWHRGAGREGIDLDVHFLAGLACEILEEDLIGLDRAHRLRPEPITSARPGHHQGRDEGLPWGPEAAKPGS